MRYVHLYAVAAGVFFGTWPLVMNRSGLEGFASAAFFAGIAFVTVLPFALGSGQVQKTEFTASLLAFGLIAGILGGIGVLAFNTMLAKVTPKEVGMMFMIMLMFQLSVPAIYHLVQGGDLSPRKVAGVTGAFIVAYLLA